MSGKGGARGFLLEFAPGTQPESEESAIMNLRKTMILAATLLSCTMLLSTAFAARPEKLPISALQGVDAQVLTPEEMQSISGEVNALEIAAALTSMAAKLDKVPFLQTAVLALADFFTQNKTSIDAMFTRLGIYTPPK
jgi:hypothetical protein